MNRLADVAAALRALADALDALGVPDGSMAVPSASNTVRSGDELLTVHEVSEMLRRPPSTLGKWRENGVGPPWARFVGVIRYRHRDVEAWIDAQFVAADRGDEVDG